jgi:DNA mismatch repair protein MSH4
VLTLPSCTSKQLRTNILSPLTDSSTIDTRLDVVAELIESESRFRALRKALQQLDRIDADKITGDILNLTSVTQSEKIKMRKMSDPAKESEKKIQLVLQLRTFIKQLPNIKSILLEDGKPKSVMLATVTKILGDDRLKAIEEEIANTLNEQALAVSHFFLLLD